MEKYGFEKVKSIVVSFEGTINAKHAAEWYLQKLNEIQERNKKNGLK